MPTNITYLLDDIAAYIDANTSFTSAVDLFAGMLPDESDPAIAIMEYAGARPEWTMGSANGSLPAISKPKLQVMSRATSYTTARSNAWTVHNLLIAAHPITLAGTRYDWIEPIQSEPFSLGRDDSRRTMFACNYICWRQVRP